MLFPAPVSRSPNWSYTLASIWALAPTCAEADSASRSTVAGARAIQRFSTQSV